MDDPAEAPQSTRKRCSLLEGKAGYSADAEATTRCSAMHYVHSLDERDVELIIVDEPATSFNLELLHDVLERQIEASGLIGSLFIADLQTGEEIAINADIALSGMSIVKIPIMLELFRVVDDVPQCRSTKLLNGNSH